MNPPITPRRLLGLTCAGLGLVAIALVAQTPPAAHETSVAADGDKTTPPNLCGIGAVPLGAGPIGAIQAHVCGFHFYNGDMKRALRVEHYCSHLNADVFQCVIYDSDQPNARLIGVEYVISEALFKQLPEEEKKLWHSHRYEVMSGQLTAPGLSDAAEKELMKEFVGTYGKTWHLWQVDRGDKLPLGLPKLMMGFTADGQADPQMVTARDRDLNIDSSKVKARRADIPTRPVAEGADGWQQGAAFQINDDLLKETQTAPKP
jgi:hypothetical protein